MNSIYQPTPTIVEAAQALYQGHTVQEIARYDAANLRATFDTISCIVEAAKQQKFKAICFITGVPGAGKTLAGLNIANERLESDENEHAVFLSGNGPLVEVLREALARNQVEQIGIKKSVAQSKARAFIQNIHHFRDDALKSSSAPTEKVVVFDEAQRAWTREQASKFMRQKRGKDDFELSEPEFLISVIDRHVDWATIICLIGGGQEINTGEAGLPEWFFALGKRFPHWGIFVSNQLSDFEYTRGQDLFDLVDISKVEITDELHLAVSTRSFRSEKASAFIKALLDVDIELAMELFELIHQKYPIALTRSLFRAKAWLRSKARGTERFGLLASSGAHRLKPEGINVRSAIEPVTWFLNDKYDVRSSYYLEDAATEFDIQGLELDWTCVGWDADLRYVNGSWEYRVFKGSEWMHIRDSTRQFYLKNAYRVLLTRARQGMVIFVPFGDNDDRTRQPEFYDGTFNYLKEIGLPII